MKSIILTLVFLTSGTLFFSCSSAPKRKVAGPGTPAPAQMAADGRIQPRGSAENRKRVEHYNSLQHK